MDFDTRRIAVAVDRPVSTVRRWLRRLPAAHLERIYQGATRQPLELDPDVRCATPQPAASRVVDPVGSRLL
ncbi:hypothetical protein [Mycobacterium avium]|jgi:hypothetical protein|uniref:hypothetical protein n=1 Tax=Mycobacterium avium TaxID=1764 RepID=UPI0004AD5C79|nr:hypothetical protein [Mycobacterium avium]